MDALVQQALQGTTRQPAVTLPLPPPLDQLFAGLPNPQDDMRLLLAAGAAAVYRQAGSPLAETPPLPDAAAPESTPVCPPAVSSSACWR